MSKPSKEKQMPTRTTRACIHCRRQKMRCEGADDPPCTRCRNNLLECVFERRTDYLLNPEDKAWQRQMEVKVNELSKSVEELFKLVLNFNSHPSLQPQPQLRPLNILNQSFQVHDQSSTTSPSLLPISTLNNDSPASELNQVTTHKPDQNHINSNQSHQTPINHHHPSNTSSLQHPQYSIDLGSQLHSHSPHHHHHHRQDDSQGSIQEPLLPSLDLDHHSNQTSSPHHHHHQPLITHKHISLIIDQDQAQEIFGFVRERYRMQLPVFKLIPNPSMSASEMTSWAKTVHPFVGSVILTHGSSHHPSPRSAALFGPLLNEAADRFKSLVSPILNLERPHPSSPSNSVFWTDLTGAAGYKIVLTMCIATIYLGAPNPPYRFLSPSLIIYLLRCPTLSNSYQELFEPDSRSTSHQLHQASSDPSSPTPLSRYTLYIWLYMIFCHFSSPDLILPDDITDSRSIKDIRRLLSLDAKPGTDPIILQLLCAHSELAGLQQWSRKKWRFETEWNLSEPNHDSLLDLQSFDFSLSVWWSRFEETRKRLTEWDQTWSCTQSADMGYLSRMVWMHYEAKQAANYASALFRLPSDPSSWPVAEHLYQVALDGVRQSCYLLQSFIGEEPIRGDGQFPVSEPLPAPWQQSMRESEGVGGGGGSARVRKRLRGSNGISGGDGGDEVGEESNPNKSSTVDLKDYLPTCPVSIQRYPIPFAGVILKAVRLKHVLGIAGVEVMIEGHRQTIFEELQVGEAFNLLDRVIHVCAVAGLDGNHPVSPTAFELAKMVGIARRSLGSTQTPNSSRI